MGSNSLYFGIELVAVYPFPSPLPCLSVDFYNEQYVYAAPDNNGVFFESTDGGVSLPIPEIFSR